MNHGIRAVIVLFFLTLFSIGANAHNKVVVIPMDGDSSPVFMIGDTGPAGGIVFHVTDGGRHGLEAAPEDQSASEQYCSEIFDIPGIVNLPTINTVDPNSGAFNTQAIIDDSCGDSGALVSKIAIGWFLPNKEELNLLYLQKDIVGGFASADYMSSSKIDNLNSWVQLFSIGSQTSLDGGDTARVRAIRAF